jgi:hypothetical protein
VFDTTGIQASEAKALAISLGKPGAWIVAPGLTKRSNLPKIQRGGESDIAQAIEGAPRSSLLVTRKSSAWPDG